MTTTKDIRDEVNLLRADARITEVGLTNLRSRVLELEIIHKSREDFRQDMKKLFGIFYYIGTTALSIIAILFLLGVLK